MGWLNDLLKGKDLTVDTSKYFYDGTRGSSGSKQNTPDKYLSGNDAAECNRLLGDLMTQRIDERGRERLKALLRKAASLGWEE